MADALTFAELLDLAEGRLSPAAAAAVQARLANDPAAQAELAQLQRMIGLMRSDESIDPPSYVVARALRIMPAPQPQASLAERLQRWVANLNFDSRSQQAIGVRGQGGPQQLLFSAADWTLDLRLVPVGNRVRLDGQLLGPEEAGTVLLTGPVTLESALNSESEFSLNDVPPGSYRLLVRLESCELTIEELVIGEP